MCLWSPERSGKQEFGGKFFITGTQNVTQTDGCMSRALGYMGHFVAYTLVRLQFRCIPDTFRGHMALFYE